MSIPTGPCKDCTKRHPNCHSSCEGYLAFRAELDEYNEMVRRQKQIDRLAKPEKPKRRRKN